MPRRKGALDRDALREKLLAVAEALVLQGGPAALTARALATHIGYSLGHVYNLVTDLDELVLLINARTLTRLMEALEEALEDEEGQARIHKLAEAYLHFCQQNAALWNLALSHRLPAGKQLPADYAALIGALPALVSAELKALFPKRTTEQIRRDVAVLWSALYGLSTLDNSGRLALIGAPKADGLTKQLLDTYLAGLAKEKNNA
jgi:AcrR family transcriptional regulator